MGDVDAVPGPVEVGVEVLVDEDLADRGADTRDLQAVAVDDLLRPGELVAVEVEHIRAPGATKLQIRHSQLADERALLLEVGRYLV